MTITTTITTTTTFAIAATAAIAAGLLTLSPMPAHASDDHAHAAPTLPAAASPTAATRFALVSDTLELVGVLNGQQLTLYLDRAADNSPVSGARIALEIGGQRIDAAPHGAADDHGHTPSHGPASAGSTGAAAAADTIAASAVTSATYEASLPTALGSGHWPVSATVTVGEVRSVLVGELDLPATSADHDDGAAHGRMWSNTALWAAAGLGLALALAALLAWGLGARRARRRLDVGSTAHTRGAA